MASEIRFVVQRVKSPSKKVTPHHSEASLAT